MFQGHASVSGRYPGSSVVLTIDLPSEGIMTAAVRIPRDTKGEDLFYIF